MSAFYDNDLTDAGRSLLLEMQMGAKFQPTKIVMGSGYMPAGKTTRTMTAVASPVIELSLNKYAKMSNTTSVFGAAFSNEEVTEPFFYRELGLYARAVYADGTETEEVLYSYGNAGDTAEEIPAYGTNTVVSRQLDLLVYIGNDTEVVVEFAGSVYVDYQTFSEAIATLEDEKADTDFVLDSVYSLSRDIVIINEKITDEAERINSLFVRVNETDLEVSGIKTGMERLERLIHENAAKIDSLWDAILTDITANHVIVDFDTLDGFILVGGVWYDSVNRIEV